MQQFAVECAGLHREYRVNGKVSVALDGLDLQIESGTVFGLLGPNGAGKTTTARILSTLLIPTGGTARVLGHDVVTDARAVRRSTGLILGGERGFFGRLSGRQNLHYFASLNGMSRSEARKRVSELLDVVRLTDRADSLVEQYSRGMRQRLHIARGLLNDPSFIIMDEPTTGLDPQSALELRELVPTLADAGKTILLTTHYMFEADALCQKLAILQAGKIIALGTSSEIKRTFSRLHVFEITVEHPDPASLTKARDLPGIQRSSVVEESGLTRLTLCAEAGWDAESELRAIFHAGPSATISPRDPTLEEAYLSLLGREQGGA